MATFVDRFRSFYQVVCRDNYPAWEIQLEPLDERECASRRVAIDQVYEEHPTPLSVGATLSRIITPEMHARVVEGNFDRAFFETHGFRVLKASGTLVLEHPDLPDHLIKTAQKTRTFMLGTLPQRKEPVEIAHTNLLRPMGRAYFAQRNTDPLFSFPEEYLYRYSQEGQEVEEGEDPLESNDSPHRRYYAISEKVPLFSVEESVSAVKSLPFEKQKELAHRVSTFIKATGFTDMHADNLRLRSDYLREMQFSVIDLEPLGVFIEQTDCPRSLLPHEQRVFVGLVIFRDYYCRAQGLTDMAHYVDDQIETFLVQNGAALKPRPENSGEMSAGYWTDTRYEWDWKGIGLVILTIPFFWIILPILALRAACETDALST